MAPGRVALVTDANRGIGKETARHLAARGATVLVGCRDLERAISTSEELAVGGADVVPVLDVTDEASVVAVTERVSRFGRLDILIDSAAVFVAAPVTATTAEVMRTTFEVNVFGVVRVTRYMLPLLRESSAPRIVNVSSTTASLELTSTGAELPGNPDVRMAYTCSKAALNMLTIQYAMNHGCIPGARPSTRPSLACTKPLPCGSRPARMTSSSSPTLCCPRPPAVPSSRHAGPVRQCAPRSASRSSRRGRLPPRSPIEG